MTGGVATKFGCGDLKDSYSRDTGKYATPVIWKYFANPGYEHIKVFDESGGKLLMHILTDPGTWLSDLEVEVVNVRYF